MSWSGECEFYAPILAEILKVVTGELGSVVCDDLVWDPEACDHVGPYKPHDLQVRYLTQGFGFHPLREVFGDH